MLYSRIHLKQSIVTTAIYDYKAQTIDDRKQSFEKKRQVNRSDLFGAFYRKRSRNYKGHTGR